MLNTTRLLLAIIMLAGVGWCLYLLIPTRQWVHVATAALLPGLVFGYAVYLARRGLSEVADALTWIAVLITSSCLAFARTIADCWRS